MNMMNKFEDRVKADGRGQRNYDKEARELLQGLTEKQLYQLFEIVHKEMRRHCSDDRSKELVAVKKAIRQSSLVDTYRIDRLLNGYKSEMAQTGKAKDGQKRPWRKSV